MKNIIRNTVLVSLMMACISFFTACLKDDANYKDFSAVGTVIELLDADPALGLTTSALTFSKTPVDISTRVNVAAPYPLTSSLNVTLSIDKAAFATWKKVNADTTYELLPDSSYTVPSASVTIPANTSVASFVVKVNSSKIDLTHSYVLPVSIADASGQNISGNFKTILYAITVKNIYDGDYLVTGTLDRQGKPTDAINETDHLSTVSGNTSSAIAPFFGNSGIVINVQVNADNTVTVTPSAAAIVDIRGTVGKTSTYDPAKKQFHLYYGYKNGSGLTRIFDVIYTAQ